MSLFLQKAVRESLHGKYELPFIVGPAVAGAATAISAAAAAGTAAAIGSAVVATASAIGAIATVAGLAMTVVGAITGNEDLMKIGGYVGLAGGVTSLATSAISGATSAATTAASEATKAGTQAAGQAATSATSTAASNAASVGSEVAKTATQAGTQASGQSITSAGTDIVGKSVQGATQSTGGLLGEAGKAALTPTSMAELPKLGADIGANTGNVGVTQTATQSASFFDQLMQPTNLLEIGKIGAGALSGMNKSDQFDRTLELQQQQLQHNIDQDTMHNRNANYQGRGMLKTRALTQEERDAAAAKKAAQAKKMATILTAPAGS